MGIVWITTAYLWKLSVPAEFPLQERARVHPDLCEAFGNQDQGAKGQAVQRSNGVTLINSSLVDERHQGLKKSSTSPIEGIAALVL